MTGKTIAGCAPIRECAICNENYEGNSWFETPPFLCSSICYHQYQTEANAKNLQSADCDTAE